MNNRKIFKKEQKKELQNKLISAAHEGYIELIKACQENGVNISADADGNLLKQLEDDC